MSGRPTRVFVIGLAIVSVLIVAAWIASTKWALIWQASNFQTGLAGGVRQFSYWSSGYYGVSPTGLHFDGWGGGFRWWGFRFDLPGRNGMYSAVVPIWLFALLAGAWPAFFWVRHSRRRRRSQCPECGYLLQDLPAPVVCPECGYGKDPRTSR